MSALLAGLPTLEDIKHWEDAVKKPTTQLEAQLAVSNLIAALYRSRRRLEAIAMGRDVEATVIGEGGGL
jgi:hypothetical protein